MGIRSSPLDEIDEESPEGLMGIPRGLAGEAGLEENALVICVIGVLEGRSRGSKLRNAEEGIGDMGIGPVLGTEGREKEGLSSSSSIEGKWDLNSDRE